MRESYENRRRLWTRVARPSEARPRYNEERKRKGERFLALVPTIPWCTHHRVINYLARPLIKKFSSLAAATSLSLDPLTSSMRRQRLGLFSSFLFVTELSTSSKEGRKLGELCVFRKKLPTEDVTKRTKRWIMYQINANHSSDPSGIRRPLWRLAYRSGKQNLEIWLSKSLKFVHSAANNSVESFEAPSSKFHLA